MKEKTRQSFSIYFDTTETEDHTMDAAELGLHLVAMNDALKKADRIINGEESQISVKVSAPEEGSIGVPFCVELLGTSINIIDMIGFSAGAIGTTAIASNVIEILTWIKSRKITAVKRIRNDKSIITVSHRGKEETIEVDPKVEKLVTDVEFRSDIHKALFAPVRGKENAKILIKDEAGEQVFREFNDEEIKSLKQIPKKTLVEEEEEVKTVHARFTKIDFEKTTGWVINYLNNPLTVSINDEAFIHRNKVSENSFKSGDMFEIDLRIITKNHPDRGIDRKYSIDRVKRKITKNRNLR